MSLGMYSLFDDEQPRDEHGRWASVGYHGSGELARRGKFDGLRLDISPIGKKREVGETIDSMGTWFSVSPKDAAYYGRYIDTDGMTRKNGLIIRADVRMRHPKIFNSPDEFVSFVEKFRGPENEFGMRPAPRGDAIRAALEAKGHDGIVVRGGGKGDGTPDGADTFLSFGNSGVKNESSEERRVGIECRIGCRDE